MNYTSGKQKQKKHTTKKLQQLSPPKKTPSNKTKKAHPALSKYIIIHRLEMQMETLFQRNRK